MTAETPDRDERPTVAKVRPRSSRIAWRIILAGLIALALTLVILFGFFRGSAPLLTAERLAAAEKRWRARSPASYNIDLQLVGTQAGAIQVEVRKGKVTRMVRNGYQPSQTRTWYYWSVPGQFETMQVDLAAAEHPEQGFGVAPGTEAILRADFDPTYGYPFFYQRILLGTGIHVEWQVTRFQVVTP